MPSLSIRRTIGKAPAPLLATGPGTRLRAVSTAMAERPEFTYQPGGVQVDPTQDLSRLAAENIETIHREDTNAPSSVQTTLAASDMMSKLSEKRLEERVKRGSL